MSSPRGCRDERPIRRYKGWTFAVRTLVGGWVWVLPGAAMREAAVHAQAPVWCFRTVLAPGCADLQ